MSLRLCDCDPDELLLAEFFDALAGNRAPIFAQSDKKAALSKFAALTVKERAMDVCAKGGYCGLWLKF